MGDEDFFFSTNAGYVTVALVSTIFVVVVVVYPWAHNRKSSSMSQQHELDKEFDWNNESQRGFLPPIKSYSSRFNNNSSSSNDLSTSLMNSVEEGSGPGLGFEGGDRQSQHIMPNPIPSPITFRSSIPTDITAGRDDGGETSTVTGEKMADSPAKRNSRRSSQRERRGSSRRSQGSANNGGGKSKTTVPTASSSAAVVAPGSMEVNENNDDETAGTGANDTTFQTLFNDQDAFSPYSNIQPSDGGIVGGQSESLQDERVIRYSVGVGGGGNDMDYDNTEADNDEEVNVSVDNDDKTALDFLDRNSF